MVANVSEALTLGAVQDAPVVTLDFDWTCARCKNFVPRLPEIAQPDLDAGRVRLRLRPHQGRHATSQQLYALSLGAATLGEVDQLLWRLLTASIKVEEDIAVAAGPRLPAWQAAAAELPSSAFAQQEEQRALAMIGRRMLPVLSASQTRLLGARGSALKPACRKELGGSGAICPGAPQR